MKKVLALLAIAGFVACNSGETHDAAADSTKKADSIKKVEDSLNKVAADTLQKKSDSLEKKADSLKKA